MNQIKRIQDAIAYIRAYCAIEMDTYLELTNN